MPRKQRAPFVALSTFLLRRFPDLDDLTELVASGRVLVNGAPALSPRARVRADASIRILNGNPTLRGTRKLEYALGAFDLDVSGAIAIDLGAAAGGFTQALLDAGARRVYAVDTGIGQLRGSLRNDDRVINLERTNISQVGPRLIHELATFVTMDLSYVSIADALPQLDRRVLGERARLLALVKPTFELRTGILAATPADVDEAVAAVRQALTVNGWRFLASAPSPILGSKGAVEAFVYGEREQSSSALTPPTPPSPASSPSRPSRSVSSQR